MHLPSHFQRSLDNISTNPRSWSHDNWVPKQKTWLGYSEATQGCRKWCWEWGKACGGQLETLGWLCTAHRMGPSGSREESSRFAFPPPAMRSRRESRRCRGRQRQQRGSRFGSKASRTEEAGIIMYPTDTGTRQSVRFSLLLLFPVQRHIIVAHSHISDVSMRKDATTSASAFSLSAWHHYLSCARDRHPLPSALPYGSIAPTTLLLALRTLCRALWASWDQTTLLSVL